jgi:hypothetical protein
MAKRQRFKCAHCGKLNEIEFAGVPSAGSKKPYGAPPDTAPSWGTKEAARRAVETFTKSYRSKTSDARRGSIFA